MMADGVSEDEYVEVTGLLGTAMIADTLATALGVPCGHVRTIEAGFKGAA